MQKMSRAFFPTLTFLPLSVMMIGGIWGSSPAFALSPPWYLLQSKVKATIGNDPCARVEELEQVSSSPLTYNLDIHVCEDMKADALSAFMTQNHDFGGVHVRVRVLDSHDHVEPGKPVPTQPEDARNLIEVALKSNCYFVRVDPERFTSQLFIEFTPDVAQYFADNISDYYQNNNDVVAAAFSDVLELNSIPGIHIGVTTSPKEEQTLR